MAMTKKDFIALADLIRQLQPDMAVPQWAVTNSSHAEKQGQQAQWLKTRDALAEFCKSQNAQFMRERWLNYIAGECGKNGGKIKAA